MINFKNKTVVITGAAGGLGKALALEFYKQGSDLALIDIDTVGLDNIKSELIETEQIITIHKADISKEASIVAVRTEILDRHKRIDVLINNAGISISQNFEQLDLKDYKHLFDTNFWGTIYCTKHFLSDLKNQIDSRIVNIISDFSFMGFPGKTAYGSSKSAILGFTNSLKTELAETNVKVSFVVPPPLDTGLVKNSKHINEQKRVSEASFLKKNGLSLDKTAQRIVRQIRRGKYRIIIGTMMFAIDLTARLFPTFLHYLVSKNKKRFDFI